MVMQNMNMQNISPEQGGVQDVQLAYGRKLLAITRKLGLLGAFFFVLAFFGLGDSLQSIFREDFNRVEIVAGGETLLAGPLPSGLKSHENLPHVIEGSNELTFEPLQMYKGFWFGGNMWRGKLKVGPNAKAGNATLTVIDIIELEQKNSAETIHAAAQNPALVYSLFIWPDAAAKQAASFSVIKRHTGLNGFGIAGIAVLLGIGITFTNWRLLSKAEPLFVKAGIFAIQGCKKEGAKYTVIFSDQENRVKVGKIVQLYDRNWHKRSEAKIEKIEKNRASALVLRPGVSPRFGWLVSLELL